MSSGELNFESFNFSGCGFSDRPVSGVSGHTFDHLCRPHCHKLSALDKAWNGRDWTRKPDISMDLTHTGVHTTLRPVVAHC